MFSLPSTRQFFREAKSSSHLSLFDLVHGYFYGRWTYFYIAVGTGEHPLSKLVAPVYNVLAWLFRKDRPRVKHADARDNGERKRPGKKVTIADTYHGKVVPLEAARKLVSINQDVTLRNLEHVIPYSMARDIVLNNPNHIAVLQCPCRTARKKPCTPLDVCLIVGEPFVGFTLDHHPHRSRRITQEEAVEILRDEDRRGHVHHAFFKDAMLGRFYAICNCCRCCCGAMQAHRNGTPMLASSGYVAVVNRELCISCGTCAKYCQFDAVTYIDGVKNVDAEKCMGCGVCVPKCTKGAISLGRDLSRSVPLEIEELMSEAKYA
jgi:Pyruvate/2-oxoacid:ferredoxin oxidoreductase delta subunit